MSSVFDSLMHDLGLLYRDLDSKPAEHVHEDSARMTELGQLETGIMHCDSMNACRCFMVEFFGREAVEIKEPDDSRALTEGEVNHINDLIGRSGGALVTEVRKLVTEQNCKISKIGGGTVGWVLGVQCSPGEAWLLCQRGRERFIKALQNGLIDIRISPWMISPYYQGE